MVGLSYAAFSIFSVTYFHGRVVKDPTSRKPREAKFAFDHVFGPSATNIEVYEQTTKSVLRALVEGYNCSGLLLICIIIPSFGKLESWN